MRRIAARLRGEKALDAENMEVQVVDESTAVLKGLVLDKAAKEKAVALTRDTRNVSKAVDRLALVPPPRIVDAPPADAVSVDLHDCARW